MDTLTDLLRSLEAPTPSRPSLPQFLIGLHVRDAKTLSQVWRTTKRALNPIARRRMGLRGRSSLLREFMLYGFEQASKDPGAFLRSVREHSDPLLGHKGRGDAASEERERLVSAWEAFIAANTPAPGAKRRGRPAKDGAA